MPGKKERTPRPAKFDPRPLEMAVIGFVMTYPERFYDVADLREEHFITPSARKMWRVLREIEGRNHHEISETAIIAADLARIGVSQDESLALMVEASDYCPASPEAIAGIRDQLLTASLSRSLAEAGKQISRLAEEVASVDDAGEQATSIIQDAIGRNVHVSFSSLAECLDDHVRRIASASGDLETGHSTGLEQLDALIGGLRGGELIIVAARPKMGKSSLAGHFALSMAHKQGIPGAFFSLEMNKTDLTLRFLSNMAHVNLTKVRKDIMDPVEREAVNAWIDELRRAPLFIDDTGGISMARLGAALRRMYYEENVRFAVVDYLQIMDHNQKGNQSTTDAIGRTTTAMKALARNLNIPIILLSQLNRDPEKRDNKRPRLSDLRSSGAIEQDADAVIFVHREEYFHDGDEDWLERNRNKQGLAELIVAAQRNGPVGTAYVRWIKECAAFANLAPGSMSEVGTHSHALA